MAFLPSKTTLVRTEDVLAISVVGGGVSGEFAEKSGLKFLVGMMVVVIGMEGRWWC